MENTRAFSVKIIIANPWSVHLKKGSGTRWLLRVRVRVQRGHPMFVRGSTQLTPRATWCPPRKLGAPAPTRQPRSNTTKRMASKRAKPLPLGFQCLAELCWSLALFIWWNTTTLKNKIHTCKIYLQRNQELGDLKEGCGCRCRNTSDFCGARQWHMGPVVSQDNNRWRGEKRLVCPALLVGTTKYILNFLDTGFGKTIGWVVGLVHQ